MKSIIHKKFYKLSLGTTLMELVLAVTLMTILMGAVIGLINIPEYKRRARDNKRLTDLLTIERMANEFFVDNEYYPDIFVEDMSPYHPYIPVDPINDGVYVYEYVTDGASYEINATLEAHNDLMEGDGGNNGSKYELGNSLVILP